MARCLATAFAALLPLAAAAQDDLRDEVTLRDGRTVRGRVQAPWADDELVVLQGGRRVRLPREQVAATRLVGDRVRAFFERRLRHRDSARAQRYLVDEAESAGLPGMARLLATVLVLERDDDELHRYLGHRESAKGWLWPHDGRWLTRDQLERALPDEPLRLVGERFALTCDAGLATNARALLDLEHLGVVWFARFGEALDLREVLRPIEVRTFRNADAFPKWGFRPRPYYEPPPHGDLARTFFAGPQPERPELLFFVGAQGLLYRTMIGEVQRENPRDRACAWLEVGLGMHLERLMQGPAGFAAPASPEHLDLAAMRALNRDYRLTHLVHLPMYGSFYLTDDTATATNWSAAEMFVTWLLREDNQPPTRAAFLAYVRAALAERQGDSSSAFDRVFGRPIEQFEEPWRAWLNRLAGY